MVENEIIVGAAGSFVAAALETAGFYAQGEVLHRFSGQLKTAGALIFTWYSVGAILSLAVYGNYRKALLLLIGPALFYFMLGNTTDIKSVAHKFGQSALDPTGDEVLNALKESEILSAKNNPTGRLTADAIDGFASRYKNKATISTFVVFYDRIISSLAQNLVKFLTNTKNNEHLIKTMREGVFRRLAKMRIENAKYIKLTSIISYGLCAQQLDIQMELSKPPLSNAKEGSANMAMKLGKQDQYESIKKQVVPISEDIKPYIKELGFEAVDEANCEQVWQYVKKATQVEAVKLLSPTTKQKQMHPEVDWKKVYEDVVNKINAESATNNDVVAASQVLGAFMLRNTLAYTPHQALTTQVAGREDWQRHLYERNYGDYATRHASAERLKIIYAAGYIPYLQGVILYILAVSFPFFTLFFLMPSRMSSFVVWPCMWLWVKSWDVGYAMVGFARDVFWELMPHIGEIRTKDNFNQISENINWDDPASVFYVMYNSDPTAHHNTYFVVIGLLFASVPFITAHMCLGASNLWDALKVGLDQSANSHASDKEKKAVGDFADEEHKNLLNEGSKSAYSGAIDGVTNAGSIRRNDSGESLERYARGRAAVAEYRHYYSKRMTRQMSAIGAAAKRRDPRARHMIGEVINHMLNLKREPYEVDHWAKTSVKSIFSSGTATNSSGSIKQNASPSQANTGDD